MKFSANCSRSRGFTMLELLVVVSIVAVLSAIGVQVFRATRQRANQVVSTANIRQLASANLLYVSDHQTFCPAASPNNLMRWHGARTGPKEKFDPTKGYLAEYLGESRSVGQCPELKTYLTGEDSWEDGSGGYGYNSHYIGGMPHDTHIPNRPAAVRDLSRTLMFATTAFAMDDGLQEYPFADPPQYLDMNWRPRGSLQPSVHFRFNGRALIAWCDGHVSAELPSGSSDTNFYGGANRSSKLGFCGPAENNGWWNPRN